MVRHPESKKCSKCNEIKELALFSKQKANNDGFRSYCKECMSVSKKKYRQENRDKILEQGRKYQKENRNKMCEYSKKNYLKYRDIISDNTIKKYLKNTLFLQLQEISQEMIELKKEQILLTRELRSLKNGIT